MNIHEHQAKQILKKFGIEVPDGVFALSVEDLVVADHANGPVDSQWCHMVATYEKFANQYGFILKDWFYLFHLSL